MYDLSILRALLKRATYQQYRNYLDQDDFSRELLPILRGIDDWHAQNTIDPSVEDIANTVFAVGVQDGQVNYLREVFNTLAVIPQTDSVKPLLERFKQSKVCEKIALAAYNYTAGLGRLEEVLELTGQLKQQEIEVSDHFVTDDITDILDDTVFKPGLRWRLKSLNSSLGSLRTGDFGFIFARPETGKTTFIADQTTFMASQLSDDAGPILWFNNEEQGKKVRLRTYEAALGATLSQILRARDRAKDAYLRATKGKIWIVDDARIGRQRVETLCSKYKPSLIIFDQFDKIEGFEEDRNDLEMGARYQWGRQMAKSTCPVIGVCQADGTGENQRWLHMGNVSLAKTAKQAEADWILGIGKIHDTGFEQIRFFNISKNKLVGDEDTDPKMRHGQFETLLNAEIARYEDL